MKIVILAGADPRRSEGSVKSRLPAGTWRISSEHRKDTLFSLSVFSPDGREAGVEHFYDSVECTIREARLVQIGFAKRGTESHVNVIAELVV